MKDIRPNPDEILSSIYNREKKEKRGKLKIFFGYAAGVGKTYAMLEDAHDDLEAGRDVVVGYIEPHTRPETMKLLEGLELLPNKEIPYKGIVLKELDIDEALKRDPDLILVDELAHTNAIGSRHSKRYSDIEELLDAGIDVYTTVNVQHIESLNDVVASITGVIVRERIPDRIFNMAEHIELIDIEPDDLLKRLNEGKIYKGKQAKSAIKNFFSKGNLIALREIALRRTADVVNKDMDCDELKLKRKYYTNEHILVCLSSSPSNSKVIRTAARMAHAFHAYFTALFVETPNSRELEEKNIYKLRENIKLAEELGATVSTTYGNDIAYQIAEFSMASGISKIIIGRSQKKKSIFRSSLSFADKLVEYAQDIDIYVIPDSNARMYVSSKRKFYKNVKFSTYDALKACIIMAICVIISAIFYNIGIRDTNIIPIFILGVLITSMATKGKIYGIMASVLGVIIFNFLFTPPSFSFSTYGPDYPITFLVMLTSALVTSTLTNRVKAQGDAAALTAYRTNILLQASKELQEAQSIDEVVFISQKHIYNFIKKPVVFYTVKDDKINKSYTYADGTGEQLSKIYTGDDEKAVASWVIKNKKRAGVSTDTLPGAKALYIPLVNKKEVLSVVGIVLKSNERIRVEEKSLLTALLNQISLFFIENNISNN